MKRMILLVMTAVLAMMMLTACGNASSPDASQASSEDASQPPSEDNDKETSEADPGTASSGETVVFEVWSEYPGDTAILERMVDKFNDAYQGKGYEAKLNLYTGAERSTLVAAAVETDTLPALMFTGWFTSTDYIHQGLVADVSDIVEPVRDDLYPFAFEETQINGKSYMLPLYQAYFGLMYNADIFKDAGLGEYVPEEKDGVTEWTLDAYEEEILPKLAEYFEGTEKYPMSVFAADNQADTWTLNWLTMLGGRMWDDGYSVAGEDANTVAALEKLVDWSRKGYTNSNVVTKSGTEVNGEFENQMSAVTFCQYTTYTSDMDKMEKGEIQPFDLRFGTIPQKADGKDSSVMASYVCGALLMNNGKEDQMEGGREFLRWLLEEKESLNEYSAYSQPVFTSVEQATSADHPMYAALKEIEPALWSFTGNVPGYVSTRGLLFPELQAAFSGEKTAAEALMDYQTGANEVIREYRENSLVLN